MGKDCQGLLKLLEKSTHDYYGIASHLHMINGGHFDKYDKQNFQIDFQYIYIYIYKGRTFSVSAKDLVTSCMLWNMGLFVQL